MAARPVARLMIDHSTGGAATMTDATFVARALP